MIESYAIIIGAMKSGTSSLYSYLTQHPSICACKNKEPHYFSSRFKSADNSICNADYYESLWNFDSKVHQVALEASTGYTKYPAEREVPQRIFEYGINPKFIYLVRNPFERITSHFNYRKINPEFKFDKNILNEHYLSVSSYYLQISQFLEYFPSKEQYFVVNSEDLFLNPKSTLDKILSFLQIEPGFNFNFDHAKNRTPQMSRLELLLFRKQMVSKTKYIPRPLKLGLRNLINNFDKKVEPRVLSEAERLAIANALQDDMRLLYQEFSIDVQSWGFDV